MSYADLGLLDESGFATELGEFLLAHQGGTKRFQNAAAASLCRAGLAARFGAADEAAVVDLETEVDIALTYIGIRARHWMCMQQQSMGTTTLKRRTRRTTSETVEDTVEGSTWTMAPKMAEDDVRLSILGGGERMTHSCHALGCEAPCPPRWLMCRPHWRMVPRALQRAVNDSVGSRRGSVDETWAPWWRAQARAIAHVAHLEQPDESKRRALVAKADAFANQLEESCGKKT